MNQRVVIFLMNQLKRTRHPQNRRRNKRIPVHFLVGYFLSVIGAPCRLLRVPQGVLCKSSRVVGIDYIATQKCAEVCVPESDITQSITVDGLTVVKSSRHGMLVVKKREEAPQYERKYIRYKEYRQLVKMGAIAKGNTPTLDDLKRCRGIKAEQRKQYAFDHPLSSALDGIVI